jgi:hypothetical protein
MSPQVKRDIQISFGKKGDACRAEESREEPRELRSTL